MTEISAIKPPELSHNTLTKHRHMDTLASRMNIDIPLQIDPVLFAKQERTISSELTIADLPRIVEITPNPETSITVVMNFTKSSLQYPLVNGTIVGQVVQTCQRCLSDTSVTINSEFELLLVSSANSDTVVEEGHEIYEYSEPFIDTISFLEEEIMLALPIVAKHERLDECSAGVQKWIANKEYLPAEQPKANPFAKLKDLKLP